MAAPVKAGRRLRDKSFATPTQLRVVTAAASRIRIDRSEEVKRTLAMRKDWQDIALSYAEGGIGEVQNVMDFLGDAMAKLQLFAAELDAETGEPVKSTNTIAIAAVDRLRGGDGTWADILGNLAVQLSAPGQGYLIGISERIVTDKQTGEKSVKPERWFIASIDELKQDGGRVSVEDPETGEKITLRGEDDVALGEEPDFWARIWRRSKRRASEATSPLRGVLSACEELLIIDRAFRGVARSRAWMGQIVYIPDDISFGNTDPTTDNAGDGDDDDPFDTEWNEALSTPIQDEGTASAAQPLTLRGPRRDQGSGIEVISISNGDRIAGMQDRADKLMRRIAQGLPAPPEYVFGLSEATHWGAGQIQEQAFQQYMAPLAILMVSGLSAAYHRPALMASGMNEVDAARQLIWYDASDLVVNTDQRERALDAHGAFLISDEAARRAMDFDEDDAPDENEQERRLAMKRGILAGDITEELLRRGLSPDLIVPHLTPSGVIVDTPDGGQRGTPIPGASGGSFPAATAAASRRPLGERLTEVDVTLRTRLEAALDATMREALRKVGNRLASKAKANSRTASAVQDVPPESIAATLGPSKVAAIEDPTVTIEGVVDGMRDRFMRWTEQAQRQALAMVPRLEDGPRAVLSSEQARDRTEAWAWLRAAMIDLVSARLYDPHPEAPPIGELNEDAVVPFDIVREAVARAGGAGREAQPRTASIFARIPTILRAFGIGTGPLIRRAMGSADVSFEGYEWTYGFFPRSRPFIPHELLDGVQFENFDDGVLESDGFPGPFYAPGDHSGCMCDVTPILIDGGSA